MIPSAIVRAFQHLRPGFLLLEAILGIAVFGLFLTATGLVLLLGQEGTVMGGDRVRGTSIAQEALEASRAIRDGGFAALTAGSHGIALNASKQWIYSGTESTRSGAYAITTTVTSLGSDWVQIVAQSKWKHGYTRSGSIVLTMELTDWRSVRSSGDWSAISLDGSVIDAGTPLFNSVAVAGNYTYVTSDNSSGGAGLYVFDITDTTAPARVAATFDLGTSGYGIAVKGKTLYVVTGDTAQELRVYDISSPTTLAAGNLIASRDLAGSALARSIRLHGKNLLVGFQVDPSNPELSSFDVSSTGSIVPLADLEISATVNSISLSGTSALLATSDTAAEMKMAQALASGSLSLPANGNYNVTSTEQGLTVVITGTSALLGRQKGSIQELVLFNTITGGGDPPPAPGPWYHEGSGSLVGLDADPATCYAFLAASSSVKALQIVNLRDEALAELTTYNSVSGPARGLLYDPVRDRIFLVTRKGFLIFKPASTVSICN